MPGSTTTFTTTTNTQHLSTLYQINSIRWVHVLYTYLYPATASESDPRRHSQGIIVGLPNLHCLFEIKAWSKKPLEGHMGRSVEATNNIQEMYESPPLLCFSLCLFHIFICLGYLVVFAPLFVCKGRQPVFSMPRLFACNQSDSFDSPYFARQWAAHVLCISTE